ncbi:MAG: DUF4174 domain-containing protein [Haliscomenobacter sp.]|uniref:DUF4174 domain-containing protein n=1 Tax=Haliscomenobacter sp. TaxID=2717303 RepID=UPI0029B38BD4|nr:DUF4174 domain-containing protein [Haliscomenobacter sp.]MDX2069722.1 DUF4174 domain-containing protein [Haliscomenobacter sp.]
MNSSMFCFISCLAFGVLGGSTLFAQPLEQYRWKNRILLVFAPDPQDQQLKEQLSLLQPSRAGLLERDLKAIVVNPKSDTNVTAADDKHLYQVYKVEKETFRVVLIGKDGTEKLRTSQPISPAELFRIIDAMPMRQSELKRN